MRPYTRVISSDITNTVEIDQVPFIENTIPNIENLPRESNTGLEFYNVHTAHGIKEVSKEEFCRIVKGQADAFIKDISKKLSSVDDNYSQ